MKHIIFLVFLSSVINYGFSQDYPVSWESNVERIDTLTYRVKFMAEINEPYHIYPIKGATTGLGMPTQFLIEENPDVILIGPMEERGVGQQGNKSLPYYSKGVTFSQMVKLRTDKETTLTTTIKFMACTKQMCLLPASKEFEVLLGKNPFKG
ncbi:hypothetical protein ACNR9Q_05570 [Maribacter sp. X9]|uniref:hypothetical protein n=1 Tax=Maribacter sp. X9 TaxID=3402159 RepID=UPI003AF371A2